MFRRLDPGLIIKTTRTLADRIGERFPDSGLRKLAEEVLDVSQEAAVLSRWLARPLWPVRGLAIVAIVVLLSIAIAAFVSIDRRTTLFSSVAELMQGFDAAINEIILLGVALFFLTSWETHIKRQRALTAIHVLRSLAHIVDMHQLTKDPDRVRRAGTRTRSSPPDALTAFELTRYLDFCSELLSIISKLAALHVQEFDDSGTLAAVGEVEGLCSDLSRKMWQKIMVLDRIIPGP